METLPTLRQLQYLVALADYKSFQKAASSCNVTQSTLSGAVKEMEAILRGPVIDRSNRRDVRLTPLGEDMLAAAARALAIVSGAASRAKTQSATPLAWPVRLGVIPTVAPYLLPRLLKPLKKSLPALDLHIFEHRSEDLVTKLHDGTLDLALMAFPYDTNGLHEHILFAEKFICAAPKGMFPGKTSLSVKDLDRADILLLEDGHCLRDHALDACRLKPSAERKTFSAASLQTLIQMVAEGYGATFLPDMAATSTPLPRGLTLHALGPNAPGRKIGLAWRKGGPRDRDIALIAREAAKILKP